MVYDCFTFFNELDLLEIRLNVLKDVVDKFVLVEAAETHTGHPKPLYFEENRVRFSAFANRILVVRIDSFPPGHDAWWNENFQRNALVRGLGQAKDEDVVLISDLDEIPSPDVIRAHLPLRGVYAFNHVSYGFYLNLQDLRCRNMVGTKMLLFRDLKHGFDGESVSYDEFLPADINCGTTPTKIRRRHFPKGRGGEVRLRNAGWHFTCLGGASSLLEKMRAVAPHHGFDPDDSRLDAAKIAALVARGRGPALKMNCFAVPLDGRFPAFVRLNIGRYAHLVFPMTRGYYLRTLPARLFRLLQGRCIQFVEWVLPPCVHRWLHVVRMRFYK